MYKLSADQKDILLKKPESGMGYQILEAEVNYKQITAFVFNAELLVTFEELPEINGRAHEDLLTDAQSLNQFRLFNVLEAAAGTPPPPASNAPPAAGGALAPAPQLKCTTIAHEGFVRFSAYSSDWRIKTDGSLEKGTYVTTVGDARFAVSGLAIAGRYALPNPSPAVYAYTVIPRAGVLYYAGTARPANYQSGGGVEVLFRDGAPAGSAFRPYQIPEK